MRISDWSSDVCSSDLAIPKTPIGQNAVNVEDHHAHLAGALLYGRRYFGQYQRFGGMRYMVQLHSQITLAASKSCICKAPNNSPVSSTTNIWFSRPASISVADRKSTRLNSSH